jgi:hypothetical protein
MSQRTPLFPWTWRADAEAGRTVHVRAGAQPPLLFQVCAARTAEGVDGDRRQEHTLNFMLMPRTLQWSPLEVASASAAESRRGPGPGLVHNSSRRRLAIAANFHLKQKHISCCLANRRVYTCLDTGSCTYTHAGTNSPT